MPMQYEDNDGITTTINPAKHPAESTDESGNAGAQPLVSWMNHLLIPFSLYLARHTEATTVIFDSDDETNGGWSTDARRGAPGRMVRRQRVFLHQQTLVTLQSITYHYVVP